MEYDCCYDTSCAGNIEEQANVGIPTHKLECCIKPHWSNIKKCLPHSHKNWEIILNLEGSVTSVIDGVSYDIHPGDIMVIPPYVLHDGESVEGYTDMFLRASTLDFSDVIVVHDYDGAVFELMNLLHRLAAEQREDSAQLADSFLDTICQYIRHYAQPNASHEVVRRLKKLLFEHLSDTEFQVSQGMQELDFDKDYIRRCFKKDVGKTPLEYLTDLRIEHAKSLLVQYTFTGVADTATACGFSDSFYFSTCFKKHVGMSPLQYRKTHLE